MEALGRYVLSVTTAAIIYSVLQSLLEKKSGIAALVKLIGGLFLTFTVIAPIADIDIGELLDAPFDCRQQGNTIAAQGQQLAEDRFIEIIKQECEAYIFDKAMSYQTPLKVDVLLCQGQLPVPTAVRLEGSISPYAKSAMEQWLHNEMGIPKERQSWID